MPPKRALELMMTGRRVNAAEAFSLGFVTEVVPAADLEASVARWATALASKPPEAMRIGRTSFYETLDLAAGDALARLHGLLGVVADGEEAAEGIAAFSEKRPPRWRRTTEG
jgi:enoyl-CoA hydratase/carnithine racemase